MKENFRKIANKVSNWTGTSTAFLLAVTIIVVWIITGPIFNFSDTWQLVINTGTTIITFLMVFLIQNTQNRDGKAMQLKLDELIRATQARDAFVDLEALTDDELAALDREFREMHDKQLSSAIMKKLHSRIAVDLELRKNRQGRTHKAINSIIGSVNSISSIGTSDKNGSEKQ